MSKFLPYFYILIYMFVATSFIYMIWNGLAEYFNFKVITVNIAFLFSVITLSFYFVIAMIFLLKQVANNALNNQEEVK